MMTAAQKAEFKIASVTLDKLLKTLDKNPQKNMLKIANISEKLLGGTFPQHYIEAIKNAIETGEGVYYNMAMSIFNEIDREMLKKLILAMGLGAGVHGTKAVRENREKYKCNVPFLLLMDPTSACNLKCTGCWSAEYGHKEFLTLDEMRSIVRQGRELGTHLYMYTGGEPLMRKADLIKVCEEFPDCVFLAYTNGTLVDQAFCDEVKRVGNISFALSVEGTEETTDGRRGKGVYKKVIAAMDLMKKNGILFGMSVCYTRDNVETVTSDAFMDDMVARGVKFGLYFNYMPIGHDAPVELIPTPDQRAHMYAWTKRVRNNTTGKPLFIMDFQSDGEYVGGCIAGGRNYFHINSAGYMEPCVFIHYSDSNIRTHTLLEGLQNKLFMQFRHDQPFNDNHLRPCPMLENPECLRCIIKKTGAKSTNLPLEESADMLCSKCDEFAKRWAPKAQELWDTNKHPNPKTQYYRDTPEGKAEFAKKAEADTKVSE